MKRILFIVTALLAICGQANADDRLSVKDLTIPQGGQATLEVALENDKEFTALQFYLTLPEGVTVVTNAKGRLQCSTTARCEDHTLGMQNNDGVYTVLLYSSELYLIEGTEGNIITIDVQAAADMAVGTTATATVSGIKLAEVDETKTQPDDFTFNVTISEPSDGRTVLDELSTTLPEATDGDVDILVRRTINAGEWSTLVLPFDMTEAQVHEAFGSDVQLYEFIDYEADDDLTAITVNFDEALLAEDGFIANTPYVIRTSRDITEFAVTATIDPDEEGAVAEYTNGRTGSRKVVYGSFRGTYHAQTVVPADALFLSDNKFWYSTGLTKMKAFRAYFEFQDILAGVGGAGAKVNMNFNGKTNLTQVSSPLERSGEAYNLQGQRVDNSFHGIVIQNGKKVIR